MACLYCATSTATNPTEKKQDKQPTPSGSHLTDENLTVHEAIKEWVIQSSLREKNTWWEERALVVTKVPMIMVQPVMQLRRRMFA